ncbi:hypothetical protein JQ634_22260 [Bradyrhizobium sp. AUGA SZCCT0240]|uniref:hypothetical protein n=1 Tax=Bradyrhizobium sp. AUGA SZCCT0240 TaxID=2807669 RepID=UPI001BA9CD59|nr:hypothetical protein [Bradyrhizobium sp. AUGA SZCCT0240]MBR1256417.1 hypothetical protein [Bradyrhizobium sp. AUGA SZCCT0240]
MAAYTSADTMHRLAKRAMDNGSARSREEAEAMLRGYSIAIEVDDVVAADRHHQAALLAAVALGRRVFLGGVVVAGKLDTPLTAPLPLGRTLAEAVLALGGRIGEPLSGIPVIRIAGAAGPSPAGFCIRPVFAGWRSGIVPAAADGIEKAGPPMALAPMLAAALAVNEAFLYLSGEMPSAGKRSIGLSLWDLTDKNWLDAPAADPELRYLPTQLWLIGLGHLGQAYLFGLGLLPYNNPADLHLLLQDDDSITPSTESTSILSDFTQVGTRKTRAMAKWAESRGFITTVTERLFDAHTKRQPHEPAIALCGLDNAAGRRQLDLAGFDFVAEAGLGRGYADFRSMLIHTLPGTVPASKLWEANDTARGPAETAAYRKLLEDGSLDRCGVTLLAGKAVGAPFVGAVAATIVIAEVLRLLHGAPVNRLIDLNLVNPDHRKVAAQTNDFSALNPGYVPVDPSN